ncbi:NTF2 and RRM domain protein [Aspergillus lucknowensis]|uniref:NTF2 and RRM domain protein n=1 Tax=Aspergillus lucknowensis TaxID=176173 RepID=A0ABR4LG12_9EURO
MADTTQLPLNGTYHPQPAYHDSFNHTHTAANSVSNFQPAQSSTPSNAPPNEQKNGISKDEVGWYFVEQYYTNMSRSPDKLHHFYSRRSQLVFGTEAELVPVAVGQKAIQEKIKQLDFQDCKVRVVNVDAQASFDNILVSVIGEISNKQEASRKFVQTFVLAQQPNGYYVLNDVFRYLVDEEEAADDAVMAYAPVEEPELEKPTQHEAEAMTEVEKAQVNHDAAVAKMDEKLEDVEDGAEASVTEPTAQTNGADHHEAIPKVEEPPATKAEAETLSAEEPATSEPTPAPTAQKDAQPPTKEAAPPARAVPKTWANIASKPGATTPVVPAIPVAPVKPAAAATTPSQPSAPAPATTPAPAPVTESAPSQPSSNDGSGWQTAGHDHKKSQVRSGEDQNVLGYIKNVTEKVDANLLRQTLSRFGKLKHFDVSRQKNCAFVEFGDPAAYTAAVAANPHQIGSEQVNVEERRTRANASGGNAGYGPGRGGAGRGRGDRTGSQGRGGFQRDGRGGFAPRGRGGNVNAKGRNQAQNA